MAPLPYPSENITGIVELFRHVNDLTAVSMETGFLGVAILITVAFVSFLSTKAYSTDRAMGFAGFISLITAIFLRFLSLINDAVLTLTIIAFIGIVIFLMRERNVEEFGT